MSKTVLFAAALTVVASVFGASAFTSGYVDRTSTIALTGDATGLIGLTDGNSGDLVQITGDELTIDFAAPTGSSGANVDALYWLGDNSSGNVTYAFAITNNDASSHNVRMNYTMTSDPDGATENVKFVMYDANNGLLLQETEAAGVATTASAITEGTTVYVVVMVDTSGLTSASDLSGTLRIELI